MGTPQKTREQLEADLLAVLEERQQAWLDAPPETRRAARQQLLEALGIFKDFVLYSKTPE